MKTNIENAANIRVRYLPRKVGLAPEAFADARIIGDLWSHGFERDAHPEHLVGGGDSGACDESKVAGDVHNCGRCGHDCTLLANVAQVSCTAGQCVVNSCIADRAHCSSNIDDGCETDISKPEHCGGCNSACGAAAPLCSSGAIHSCVASCSGQTPTQCGQSCVDTQSDIHHCGSCDKMCTAPANATATCASGVCGFSCGGMLPDKYGNGCVDFQSDLHNCGSCGNDCSSQGSSSCKSGKCSALSVAVRLVAAGDGHTCVVTDSGAAQCWGSNSDGQLGNGTSAYSSIPVSVTGLSSGVTAISAGGAQTCALMNTGGVKCWGTVGGNTPTDVSDLTSGVAAISVGWLHICAVLSTGAAKCWGKNYYGQFGNGLSGDVSSVPVDVSGLASGVAAISAGYAHTCALLHSGGIKCWGDGLYGDLGILTWASVTPVDVSELTSGAAAVSAGNFRTCALTSSGGVKCWGWGNSGALGNGATSSSATPVDVTGVSTAVSLSLQSSHVCVVLASGALKCWGGNVYGQLGNNTTVDSLTPTDVSGLSSGVAAVTTGGAHSCALLSDGKLKCWGHNHYGQVGDGTNIDRHTPVDVVGF